MRRKALKVKDTMAKLVAVKAYSVGGNAFWRAGKNWDTGGSVHLLEPLDLARLRQEPRVVVVAVGESVEAIAEADAKAAAADKRLLDQADARSRRKTERALVVEYSKPDAAKAHLEECKADMAEDGCTADERSQLKIELNQLEQKLKALIEQTQKSGK